LKKNINCLEYSSACTNFARWFQIPTYYQ
jgi:hypothetical protein